MLVRGRTLRGRARVVSPESDAFRAAFEATFRRDRQDATAREAVS